MRQTISFRLHAKESNPWQIAVAVAHMSMQLLLHIHKFHAWDAAPAQTLPLEHPPRGPIHGRGQPSIVSFVSASQARQTGGWRGSGWKAEPRRESGRGRLRHERRKLVCRHCIFVHTLKCRCLRSCKFTTTCKHGVFLFLTSVYIYVNICIYIYIHIYRLFWWTRV